jgi:hypothetical protein
LTVGNRPAKHYIYIINFKYEKAELKEGSLKAFNSKALSGGVYENEGAEKNRLNFCF